MSPEDMLRELRASALFLPDFPKRSRYTHAEWATLSEEAQRAAHAPATVAIGRVKNFSELAEIARGLGRAKYEPAVPVLAKLWDECALIPVRTASGHALRAIGTPAARATLESLIEDADHMSVVMAVAAIFDADAVAAFERLGEYLKPELLHRPGGAVVARRVLATFCPSSFRAGKDGAEKPEWTEPRAPGWFRDDRRWLELCVQLRRDEHLGDVAREALRYADPLSVKVALDAARRQERPRVVVTRSAASGDLVSRYLRGEHAAVWEELRAPDAIAGDFRDEALAVATETMRRVAHGADLLAERLAERGWTALSGRLRTRPTATDGAIIASIAKQTGAPLPPSLQAFWEVVGGIDFVWNYQDGVQVPDLGVDLELDQMDPLAVDPPGVVTSLFEEWEDRPRVVDPELAEPFNLDLSPDSLHKANISGGAPYGFELPFAGADPIFVNEEHGLHFVDYLRLALQCAGFPQLERHLNRADVTAFVTEMTRGIEPF